MQVNEKDILDVIKGADLVGVDLDSLTVEESFNDQGIDSLEAMNIFLEIEDKYHVKIPDQDIEKITSVKLLVQYLNSESNAE